MKNVFCLVDVNSNLVFVSKLTKEHNCFVGFSLDKCFIQDLTMNKLIGMGKQKEGLSYLHQDSSTRAFSTSSNMGVQIIHKRLRHVRISRLKDVFGSFVLNKSLRSCDTCHWAKQCQSPFLIRNNKSKNVFDLVHLNT